MLTLLSVAMAALLVRAMVTGEWVGALFIVGLSALFGWQIGRFMHRNRPRAYTFMRCRGSCCRKLALFLALDAQCRTTNTEQLA